MTNDIPIKEIHSDNGEVYVISNGQRLKLADCKVNVEIDQHITRYTARNPRGYDVKSYLITVVFCIDAEKIKELTPELFQSIEKYEVCFRIEKAVGEYKTIKLDNLYEEEVDLGKNEWVFSTEDQETANKLLKL